MRLDPDQTAAQLLLAICEFNVQPRTAGRGAEPPQRLHPAAIPTWWGSTCCAPWSTASEAYQALSQIDRSPAARGEGAPGPGRRGLPGAEADYARALDRQPGDDLRYVLLVNRGGMYLQAGRLDESLADLEAAIRLKPGAYQAHVTLGQLHQQAGPARRGVAALGRAIERAPDPAARAALHRSRARLYANRRDLPPERLAAALADLDEAIRLEPENGAAKAERPRRARPLALRRRPIRGGPGRLRRGDRARPRPARGPSAAGSRR